MKYRYVTDELRRSLDLLTGLPPRPQGRPLEQSTLDALILTDYFGMPKRRAASIIAKETGEPLENIRKRLVALSKNSTTQDSRPSLPKPR